MGEGYKAVVAMIGMQCSSDITVVGNNNLIMGSRHIAHDCKIGNNIIFANNKLLAGHGLSSFVIHQFCHVGSFSFIGGGSVITHDVLKYMMVAGERAMLCGLNLEEIRSLRTAYQKIFMPVDKNSRDFEERLSAHIPAVHSMVQFIRHSCEEKQCRICKFIH
ncbi:unnamed protein product [Malus baccata var. baccata]